MPAVWRLKEKAFLALFGVSLALLLTARLSDLPSPWFDEGWALSIARNWVEFGHYGQMLNGQPISAGMLNIGWPAIAPIALAFRLLGVGVWQGRLVSAVFAIGSFALLFSLADRLYGRRTAFATLAVLVLIPPSPALHPVFMGRQALGEMPALFYLLAGYACLLTALQRHWLFVLACAFFWGLSLATKIQALPFLFVALLAPLSVLALRRQWQTALRLAGALLGALVAYLLFKRVQEWLLQGQMLPQMATGLLDITAIAPYLLPRLAALHGFWRAGLPIAAGLCYLGWKQRLTWRSVDLTSGTALVRVALAVQVITWLLWYLVLSVGWLRYLFPPVFVGSLFLAACLADWTNGFDVRWTVRRAAQALTHWLPFNPSGLKALAVLVFVVMQATAVVAVLLNLWGQPPDTAAQDVAAVLNRQSDRNAVVETYEMELFVLLNRRYHYPPDEVQVQADRRVFLGQAVTVAYDPLGGNPDYLVVGPYGRMWQLYDDVLKRNEFRLLKAIGPYEIYQRVRPPAS